MTDAGVIYLFCVVSVLAVLLLLLHVSAMATLELDEEPFG
jgi:hypothetical protein